MAKSRTLALVRSLARKLPALVRITEGGKIDHYAIEPIPADFGLGFKMAKQGGESDGPYAVLLIDQYPEKSSCECKGFLRWGHCRHVSALLKLVAERPEHICQPVRQAERQRERRPQCVGA